jgi:geranylgeranyl diphosphate synthase type 3
MDDVEDNSDLRRGVPVAHQVYGVPQTINTANYVYFLAFDELLKLRPLDGKGKGKAGDMVAMVNGELCLARFGRQLTNRRTAQPPSRTGYGPLLA